MRFRTYTVADGVVDQARVLGIFGDTAKRVSRMARRSALVTHPNGNRRFMDFLLAVTGSEVTAIHRVDPETMELI